MADREKTVDVFDKLKLRDLDPDWVKACWDADFGDTDFVPPEVEEQAREAGLLPVLREAQKVLVPWAEGKEATAGEGLWSVLVENDLSYKSLVAVLSYLIDVGGKRIATGAQKEGALAATAVYFTLLKVPGSGAFKIFHPMLFEKAVKMFKIWSQLDSAPKRKRTSVSPVRSSQTSKRSKSRKRSKETAPVRNPANPFAGDEEEEEDDEEEGSILSPTEIHRIQMALIQLLRMYVHLLSTYSLKDCEQSAFLSLQTLAELSKIEAETFNGRMEEDMDIKDMKTVPLLAYKGLSLMCTESHGERAAMITAVFKHLMSSLLMLLGDNKGVAAQTIPRAAQMVKDHAVRFVCYLIRTVPRDCVMPAVRVLVQHLCAKVPDKAEYRTKVAQSLVVIMGDMAGSTYARMVEWLYKYSRNAKISWRGFALDVVALLLTEPERTDEDVPEEMQVFLSHHFLVQMLLARCSDVAPTVRSRAISLFAQCLTSKEPLVSTVVRDIMTPQVAGGRGPMTRVIPTPNTTQANKESRTPLNQTDQTNPAAANTLLTRTAENTVLGVRSPFIRHLLASNMATPDNARGGDVTTRGMMTIQLTPGLEITLSDAQGVTSMLRRRAADDKVNVRKSALQALEGIITMVKEDLNKQDLDILEERCRDPALSVRKQALQCLTSLITDQPHNRLIQKAWLSGILPMVLDRESSASEKCLDVVEEILLSNVVVKQRSTDTYHQMAWQLLSIMAESEEVELRRYLAKCCQRWSRMGKLKPALVKALQSHISTDNNAGAWMLLAEMSPFAPKFDTQFLVDYWKEAAQKGEEADHSIVERVLIVLTNVAQNIAPEHCSDLAEDMKNRLMQFNSPPELTTVTVNALNKLCLAQTKDRHLVKKLTDQWFGQLLHACDKYLSKVILNQNQDEPLDEVAIIRHLFMLGEIAQLCPTQTPRRVFMLVQSLIAAPVISAIDYSSQQSSFTSQNLENSDIVPASQQPASQSESSTAQTNQSEPSASQTTLAAPSSSQGALTQGTQPWSQGTQEILSQFRGSKMSGKIRAHAFLTLGKLCLQNQDLAKKCVAALARELETSNDPTVRNNVVIIMADLCVRYTTLVDRYVSNISACMRDPSPLVRKQCLTLLTRLLQEDFLKWKGALFFHFISALIDEVKEISDFAEFCLVHLLMQRHPGMFYHHFVECIFFFNGYEQHSMYNKFARTDRERRLFTLDGEDNQPRRLTIYRFMLDHMADDHRFQLTAKLCHDVLAAVVDGNLPLDGATSALLQDTLAILSSKEIKLSTIRSRPQDEVAETEQEMAAVVMNVAKKTLITAVVKKNVIENIVPTVLGLKHMLEKGHSPVLKDLMLFLRELMKDYKNEVKDILAADKQLANEIEFDLRKFDEQQEEERAARERRLLESSANTPRNMTPRGSPAVQRQANTSIAGQSPRSPAQGSPRTPGAPQTPRAPGTPGAPGTPAVQRTPQIPATPRPQGTPQGTPAGPRTPQNAESPFGTPRGLGGTPARRMPMSTTAVLNSARKRLDKNRSLRQSIAESPRAAQGGQKRVGFLNDGSTTGASPRPDSNKTPRVQRTKPQGKSRAISTPAKTTVGNITFIQGDHNLSMIPPSPISAEASVRAYPQGPFTPSWGTRVVEDENGDPIEQDIISMASPERPTPKTPVWNIKTSGKKGSSSENVAPTSASEGSPDVTPSRRSSRRRGQKEPLDSRPNTDNSQTTSDDSVTKETKRTPRGGGGAKGKGGGAKNIQVNEEASENVAGGRSRRRSARNK